MVTQGCWGDSAAQTIQTAGADGFKITSSGHNNPNGVAAYPSLYHGQWPDGNYQTGSVWPRKISSVTEFTASAVTSGAPSKGNVAWDLWFSTTDTGHGALEFMVWLRGNVSPIGSKVASMTLADGSGWDVWHKDQGTPVVSYVKQAQVDSVTDLDMLSLIKDAISRGYCSTSWFLTSSQFGSEIWVGGTGLTVSGYSETVG